jgi:valyl-tRNA synthetase
LIRRIRNARAEQSVEPAKFIPAIISAGEKSDFVNTQRAILVALARLDEDNLIITKNAEPPDQALTVVLGGVTCYLPLAGMVDLAAERQRLENEVKDLSRQIDRLENLLNGQFANKAPAEVVNKEREKLARLQAGRRELQDRLDVLK